MLRIGIVLVIAALAGSVAYFYRAESPVTPFESVRAAMVDKEPHRIWYALPPSYQEDVETVIESLGTQIPAETYDRASAVVRSIARLLSERPEFIVDYPLVRGLRIFPEGREAAIEGLRAAGAALTTLADSELGRHSELVSLDYEVFFIGTLSRATEQFRGWFDKSSVAEFDWHDVEWHLVHEDGDRARVQVRIPDREPEDWEMVRVEGKWIPVALAEHWTGTVRRLRIALADWDQSDRRWLENVIGRVESRVDPLLAAKTQSEFDLAAQAALFTFYGL